MDNVCALSLIQDERALLFSCLVEGALRSLVIKSKSGTLDIVGEAFPRLSVVRCQNPTKLSVAQLLGTILSSPAGPTSLCASVLPIERLAKLCNAAITYESLKTFFCMCVQLVPSLCVLETSTSLTAQSPAPAPVCMLAPQDEANVELLVSSLRDKLLIMRSVATPATPSAQPLLQANPVLDQWLRGLWTAGLSPQSPALQTVSSRLAQAAGGGESGEGGGGRGGDCFSPQTDGSLTPGSPISPFSPCSSPPSTPSYALCVTPHSSISSLRDDAALLIDARSALRAAMLEKSRLDPAPAPRGDAFVLAGAAGRAEYPWPALWPSIVLAEALGCAAVAGGLVDALRRILDGADVAADGGPAKQLGLAGAASAEVDVVMAALRVHFQEHPSPGQSPAAASSPQTPLTDSERSYSDDSPLLHHRHIYAATVMSPDSLAPPTAALTPTPIAALPPVLVPAVSSAPALAPTSSSACQPESPFSPFALRSSLGVLPSQAPLLPRPCPPSPPPVPHRLPLHPMIQGLVREKEERDKDKKAHCEEEEEAEAEEEEEEDEEEDEEEARPFREKEKRLEREEEAQSAREHRHVRQDIQVPKGGRYDAHPHGTDRPWPSKRKSAEEDNRSEALILPSRSEHEPTSRGSRVDRGKPSPLPQPRRQAETKVRDGECESQASSQGPASSEASTLDTTHSSYSSHSSRTSNNSFRTDSISRTLAAIRVQPVLLQRRRAAEQAAADKHLRKSRLDGVLLQQAMARVGYGVSGGVRASGRTPSSPARISAGAESSAGTPWSRTSQTRAATPTQSPWKLAVRPQAPTTAAPTSTPVSAPDLAAQRRAQARVRARHNEMLTAEQQAAIAKQQRDRAMWAARDKKIRLFVERQRGGALYLMSSGSQPGAGYSPQSPIAAPTPSSVPAASLELHSRQPWNVDSPFLKEESTQAEVEAKVCESDGPDEDDSPPPAPPISEVHVTVIRAHGLSEGLGGCNPYVLLDWSSLGRHATRPAGDRQAASASALLNPHFHEKFAFKPPFLWSSSGAYDMGRELDGREVHITVPGVGKSSSTSTATLCAPLLRVYVYSRNVSVSDELLGEGETDIEAMLLACQQGLPFSVQLFNMTSRHEPAGSVELAFSL